MWLQRMQLKITEKQALTKSYRTLFTDSIISGAKIPLLNFTKVVCSHSGSKFVTHEQDSMCRQIKTVSRMFRSMNSTFIKRNKRQTA